MLCGKISQNYQRFSVIFSGLMYADEHGLKSSGWERKQGLFKRPSLSLISEIISTESLFPKSFYSPSISITKTSFVNLLCLPLCVAELKMRRELIFIKNCQLINTFYTLSLNCHNNPVKDELMITFYQCGVGV